MGSLLGLLGIYVLINVVVVGCGLGLALLLHWLVPAIDLGSGMLSGVLATGISMYVFGRLMALPTVETEDDELSITAAQMRTLLTTPRPDRYAGRRKSR